MRESRDQVHFSWRVQPAGAVISRTTSALHAVRSRKFNARLENGG